MDPLKKHYIALNEGAVTVEMARAGAEVHAAMRVAREFPRDLQKVRQRVEQLCTDPDLAERAQWRFQRGIDKRTGKPNILQGPSITLASALANAFGNMRYGIAQLSREIDGEGCEVRVFCIDLESNTEASMTFWASGEAYIGTAKMKTARDRYENMATQAGRRLRQQILRCLPPALVAKAVELCRQTREKHTSPLQQDLQAFAEFGIVEGDLRAYVGKPTTQWTNETRDDLHGILSTLRDNVAEPGDYFPRFRQKLAARLGAQATTERAESASTQVRPLQCGVHEATGIRFLSWTKGDDHWTGVWSIDGEMDGKVVVKDGAVFEFSPPETPSAQLEEAVAWAQKGPE